MVRRCDPKRFLLQREAYLLEELQRVAAHQLPQQRVCELAVGQVLAVDSLHHEPHAPGKLERVVAVFDALVDGRGWVRDPRPVNRARVEVLHHFKQQQAVAHRVPQLGGRQLRAERNKPVAKRALLSRLRAVCRARAARAVRRRATGKRGGGHLERREDVHQRGYKEEQQPRPWEHHVLWLKCEGFNARTPRFVEHRGGTARQVWLNQRREVHLC